MSPNKQPLVDEGSNLIFSDIYCRVIGVPATQKTVKIFPLILPALIFLHVPKKQSLLRIIISNGVRTWEAVFKWVLITRTYKNLILPFGVINVRCINWRALCYCFYASLLFLLQQRGQIDLFQRKGMKRVVFCLCYAKIYVSEYCLLDLSFNQVFWL